MTAYYLAAKYARRLELRGYRTELEAKIPGAKVVSRWIDLHVADVTDEALKDAPYRFWTYAAEDLADVEAADAVVSFTAGGGGRGGRHVEFGYALALGKRLVLVGPREHVFHCNPSVEVYPTWDDFLAREGSDGR